ncbi:aminotransferase class I/II-fold pyridoxal phosphate-dependent enzyme [Cellulophaga sp. Hel_I_12]|uniref:aminotransferase class I/II-fold pyridoxal phosphate-dependent enzyme n=1 Tax=Cellulophaga sp. Hel_I_12 TaxID=1249972 RepID=UPI000647DDD3|nr:aminotransferase class I/II-fold pyridoxal phosphate-dependent enzyme [Cellulophaga sp. Hel_I_12]
MAKIKHNNFLDTVNEVFTDAENEGVLHLYADGESFNGQIIEVKNRRLFHFGTTGYLGLEQDNRLKEAAIEAIMKYGTQFPLSKTYISNPLYRELEEKVTAMYDNPIIITKNSTLGHMGVIPSAVDDQDAIILDHQVHWSVQSAAKVLKNRSVPIDMIRHNDLNMLEDKIKGKLNKHKRIWYMADGIYSMFGDYAPIKDLKTLCIKYPQLHLYIDDVHGMSWVGKNGTGYALSELQELPENVLLFGTLSKTFGASGAVLSCSNKKMYHKIKKFGGPLTFSAQLEPASVAAAIASATIHLSSEIYELQNELKARILYFNTLLKKTDLPVVDKNNSPVFYIGTGMPKTGYNFVNRLMKEGFYVNLGLFPAVPVKNTGVRITISRHNQKEEIKGLVAAMEYHFPKALEETLTNPSRVFNAFNLEFKRPLKEEKQKLVTVEIKNSIEQINKDLWNSCFKNHGIFDWEGLKFQEKVFQNNELIEHNWTYRYVIIYDEDRKPILATYLTIGLWKDDMLSKESASKTIEEKRKSNPYFLTSTVLSLGSLFTEGNHLFVDEKHPLRKEGLDAFVQKLEQFEHEFNAKMTVLRDFKRDEPSYSYFQGQGFVRIQMPNSCAINLERKESMEQYISKLSKRNRQHVRKEILAIEPSLDIKVLKEVTKDQLKQIASLFLNVHHNNLGLNTFPFPNKLFITMNEHPQWEFIMISLAQAPNVLIGVMCCYSNDNQTYVPAFVGMDYDYLTEFHTYRQLLFQTIKRAIQLNFKKIDLGMTASFEKRKLGATVEEKFAYIQTGDNYTLELLDILE